MRRMCWRGARAVELRNRRCGAGHSPSPSPSPNCQAALSSRYLLRLPYCTTPGQRVAGNAASSSCEKMQTRYDGAPCSPLDGLDGLFDCCCRRSGVLANEPRSCAMPEARRAVWILCMDQSAGRPLPPGSVSSARPLSLASQGGACSSSCHAWPGTAVRPGSSHSPYALLIVARLQRPILQIALGATPSHTDMLLVNFRRLDD